jgi:hypothetical protein
VDLKTIGCELDLPRSRYILMAGCGGHNKVTCGIIKGADFFDLLNNYKIMKEDIADGVIDLTGLGMVS